MYSKEEISNSHDLQSHEVQEVLNTPPSWLTSWGNTILLLILLFVLFLSWLIHYPTIVKTKFVLTSNFSPKQIVTKQDGFVNKLFAKENQIVKAGDILAYMESTADPFEVLALEKELVVAENKMNNTNYEFLKLNKFKKFNQLGEIQADYQIFQINYNQMISLWSNKFYRKRRSLLSSDINNLMSNQIIINQQYDTYLEDFDLAKKEFNISEKLYDQKVISTLDLYKEKSKLLAKKIPLKNLQNTLSTNQLLIREKNKEIVELDNSTFLQTQSFEQALNTLRSSIESWKRKYLITAPINGSVYLMEGLQEKQFLKSGTEIIFIHNENNTYYGQIQIGQSNSGKVKVGQRVLVKFDSYPFEEYGIVDGTITSIAKIPSNKNSYFSGKVNLKGLTKSNPNNKYVLKSGMTATAEIITEDLRLIERLFYNIRKEMSQKSFI